VFKLLPAGFAQDNNRSKKTKPNDTGIITGYTQGRYGFGEIGIFQHLFPMNGIGVLHLNTFPLKSKYTLIY
jgi:hypothetical protein